MLVLAAAWIHVLGTLLPTQAVERNDFEGYYAAGRAILHGTPELLYSDDRKWFTNLPVLSLPLAPLGRLAYRDAWRVFWWLQVASLVATFALLLVALARFFPPLTGPRALLAGAVFLGFAPVMRRCLDLGQSTPLVVLALAAMYLLARERQRACAGAMLGLACLVKIPPTLLLGVFLARRRLVLGAAALALLATGVAVSFAWFGTELMGQYADRVIFDNLGRSQAAFNNRSLEGALMRALTWKSLVNWDPMPRPRVVTGALLAIGLAVAVLLLRCGAWSLLWPARAPRDDDARTGSFELELALGSALMLLFFPVVWIHYYLMLAVPLVLLPFWWVQRGMPMRPWVLALLLAGFWLASGTEIRGNHYYGRRQDEMAFRLAQNAQTLGALLLVVALSSPLAELARRARAGSRPRG